MSYKKTRHIRSKRNNSYAAAMPFVGGRSSSVLFLIISAAILVLSNFYPAFVSQTRMKLADTAQPLLSAVSMPFHMLAEATGQVTGLADLRLENDRLVAENERLRQWYQAALQLQAENQSLQKLLNVKVDPMYGFVSARILADTGGVFAKSILINAGTNNGVKDGQAVLSGDGLMGRVLGVGEKTARVLLLNDLNSRIPVLVENSGQRAILAGTNTSMPMLTKLPEGSEVQEGARIVTSGHGGVFPPGLPIGEIVLDTDNVYRVQLFSDIETVRFVKVVDSEENYINDNIGQVHY